MIHNETYTKLFIIVEIYKLNCYTINLNLPNTISLHHAQSLLAISFP